MMSLSSCIVKELNMEKKTIKDFGEAIEELRQNARISYDTIAFKIQHPQSYVYGLCTRRKRTLPSYEQMKEFADFFHVEPSYFYEWRLRKHLEAIDKERALLDLCEKMSKSKSLQGGTKKEKSVEPNQDDSEATG